VKVEVKLPPDEEVILHFSLHISNLRYIPLSWKKYSGQVLESQVLIFQDLSRYLPSGLSTHYDQSARSDCEDGHQRKESRKTETQQRYQPRQDEPDTCQEHAEVLV
jgi:hypothetical protein